MPELPMSPQALAALRRKQQQLKESTQTGDAHGSASWLTPEGITAAGLDEGSLLFGRTPEGVIRYKGDGHCLTFAPTGSGKSVSVVVPNLLTYPGSVVCIDPKGAIPSITARRRREMGQRTILLDPFEEVESTQRAYPGAPVWDPLPVSSYNPLLTLDPKSLDVIEDARLLAAALVVEETGKNRYFSDSARNVLECLILHLIVTLERHNRSFDLLMELAFQDLTQFQKQCLPMILANPELGGHIRRLANQIAGFSSEGGGAIWTTLRRSLVPLQGLRMLPALANSDLDFSLLKTQPTTVYLVLPARRLNTHGAWLRLMLTSILNQISDSRQPDYPVLFLMDECAALQRLEILETAVGLMRGYGMKLWLIFQDLPQLQRIYPESWGSFISNSGVRQFFNVNDPTTADFVSNFIGNETRRIFQESVQANTVLGGGSFGIVSRPVITPDEVRRLGREESILLYEGLQPIKAQKLCYYEDDLFKARADQDPYYVPKS